MESHKKRQTFFTGKLILINECLHLPGAYPGHWGSSLSREAQTVISFSCSGGNPEVFPYQPRDIKSPAVLGLRWGLLLGRQVWNTSAGLHPDLLNWLGSSPDGWTPAAAVAAVWPSVGDPPFSRWGLIGADVRPVHFTPGCEPSQQELEAREWSTSLKGVQLSQRLLAASDHIRCCSVSVFCPWAEPACWWVQRAQARLSCYLPDGDLPPLVLSLTNWCLRFFSPSLSDLMKTIFGRSHTSSMLVFHLSSLGKEHSVLTGCKRPNNHQFRFSGWLEPISWGLAILTCRVSIWNRAKLTGGAQQIARKLNLDRLYDVSERVCPDVFFIYAPKQPPCPLPS